LSTTSLVQRLETFWLRARDEAVKTLPGVVQFLAAGRLARQGFL